MKGKIQMAIRTKGTKFQVDVTVAGVRAPRVSCDTRAEAVKVEADFKAKLLAGVPPDMLTTSATSKPTAKGTLGDAVDRAYKNQWQGRKAEASSLRNADAWCLELGRDFPLGKVNPEVIGRVCDGWGAAGNAAGTINRKLAALSVMLKLAHEDGLIDRVPRLPKRKEYEGRLRYYSDDEVWDLRQHVEGDLFMEGLFVLAVGTGMRQSELLGLTKRDVDTTQNLILLGETKGNKRRSVPMTKEVRSWAVVLMGKVMDHEKIFPARITCRHISRVIAAWKHQRGLPTDDEACFHTFRHTTCSRLVQRGVSLPVVQKFMGHADITTTMRYAHLAPNSLDEARAALERG
jgi:integrase